MRLRLTLRRAGDASDGEDLLVTVDTTVTVGELATEIVRADPRPPVGVRPDECTLRIDRSEGSVVVAPSTAVADAGLRSGHRVAVVAHSARFDDDRASAPAATLVVEEGPDAPAQFPLHAGANQLGRGAGSDVVLGDPLVSKRHARINVGDELEIVDLGSSNGVVIGGERVPRARLRHDDRVLVGESLIRVVHHGGVVGGTGGPTMRFNRSPHLDVTFPASTVTAPEPPSPPGVPQRLPMIALVAPAILGAVMYAITRQVTTVLFVAFSPVLILGSAIEGRINAKRTHAAAVAAFRASLARFVEERTAGRDEERRVRQLEHRSTAELVGAAHGLEPLLWSARADARGFLDVRLGLGTLPSRTIIELPNRVADVDLATELDAAIAPFAEVDGVPVVGSFRSVGAIGMCGPRSSVLAGARAALAQLVVRHSPAEIALAAIVDASSLAEWSWLKWLPHTASDQSPLEVDHLVSTPGAAVHLLDALDELVAHRTQQLPAVVVVVEDDTAVDRSRLVDLAERGPAAGVHLLWLAPTRERLPAACKVFLDHDPDVAGRASVGYVEGGRLVRDVVAEGLGADDVQLLARHLAPVVDAGARIHDDSDLPRTVGLLSLVGAEAARAAEPIIDRWRTSGSLPDPAAAEGRRQRAATLRATVGSAAEGTFVLDLREHGPHALVGGTTGAGKSEFLQTWVMGMALEHAPTRVTFLFVDYKGGAAFGDCVHLPHTVGLVTDLSPHLVRRALASLNAELRHREHVLNEHRAKDLLELERRGVPGTPPALVIVVDEFAALVSEVPEFVDGVVNVAQRGRSLGLHLVLATQRPAGVIRDNLRANTNLRVALRMADAADSDDVVGTTAAAEFDPGLPGRALAKIGPGRIVPFQAAYVGGREADHTARPVIRLEELPFGVGATWEAPGRDDERVESDDAPTDLRRLVAAIRAADEQCGLAAPRRPWLPELAPVYDLARTPQSRTDAELVFGIGDDPEGQRQTTVAFLPDRDGNMAIFGTGGAGKTTVLRTLAVVAGLSVRGGPCHVYGLDHGARGLQVLEQLPNVGSIISGDDDERTIRLLRTLRDTIDERAVRYGRRNAGTIQEYRDLTGERDEPRILLLVDGVGAFRQEYELGGRARWFDMFCGIAADGRQVGVHVVVTADRRGAVPTALSSVIQRNLVLRLANDNDLAALGVPSDAFAADAPPGRGFLAGTEVQVAVLGGTANTARQAAAINSLAPGIAQTGAAVVAAPVQRLVERVTLDELPVAVDGQPAIGVADDTLAAAALVPDANLAIVGPPRSGRTSVLCAVGLSVRRWRPGVATVYLGSDRSPAFGLGWAERASGPDDIAELARSLCGRIGRDPSLDGVVVLVEDLPGLLNSPADLPLQELFKAARAADGLVVAEGETSAFASSWPLLAAVKVARHGIALQPAQEDGDMVFRTPFPRASRTDFPPGRGYYVRGGRARKVQFAMPGATAG